MPCYTMYDDEELRSRGPRIENQDKLAELYDAKKRVSELEASLCALITEIRNEGLAEVVLVRASRHGLIDLMKFWKEHESSDVARLSAELHKFSVHEQEILKTLLNKK